MRFSSHLTKFPLNGSPDAAWATIDVPSKNEQGRMPLVRSMICVGRTKDPGENSSRREPTAGKARIARTPRDFRAAMFARDGTAEGGMECPGPCLAKKAMRVPAGREEIVIGELGKPHG
jgi:hypothetical protein